MTENRSSQPVTMELIRGVVHEANNFVGIVSGYAAMIRRVAGDAQKVGEYLNTVDDIVEDHKETLKWLGLLDAGLTMRKAAIRSTEMFAIVASFLQTKFANDSRVVILESAAQFNSLIAVDKVTDVVCGIAAYAAESSKAGQRIEIGMHTSSERENCAGFISITDSAGCSVTQEALFAPYARPSGRANPKLSLFVSRRVMRDMGGEVDAMSDAQNHCVFRVWLPRAVA